MTDDELLVLYRSMRTLSEGMEARNAALEKSTAAQNAAIAQLNKLPVVVGQQLNHYIAAAVKESIQEDFRMPVEHAVKKPIEDLKYAAGEARRMLGRVEAFNRFESYRYMALLVAGGFVLGIGASYLFISHQLSDFNDRLDRLNQNLLLVMPAPAAPSAPEPAGKKHGRH